MATKNDSTVSTAPREVIITRTINAPRELVFDAFTKKEHLEKWFGPRGFRVTAETEPRVGGKYHIIMHGTNELPEPFSSGDYPMKGEYTEFIRPERIAYTADLSGHPQSWKDMLMSSIPNAEKENYLTGFVTITFDDLGGKTKLSVRSRFDSDAVRDGYVKFQMTEGWELSFQKLEEYLAGTVVVERTFDAPIERVWDAISNNDAMKQWYFKLPEFRAEVGFEFEFKGAPPGKEPFLHKCKVVEVIPGKKLAYSWRYEGWQGISTVAIELFAEGKQTKLRLTHSGLDSFAINNNPDLGAHNFVAGWTDIIGRSLKEFVEKRASSNDRTMAATRILNAPRELVWKVCTEPEHVKNWWGPNGFTNTIHKMEVHPGGEWNFIMHGPDGTDYVNEIVFGEIVKPERITFLHGPFPRFETHIELIDLGDKTEICWKNVFEDDQEFKQAVEVYHAVEGLDQNLGRLSEYLKSF
jgi:uncharacterized protein YndB with AHSA1/START domain